MGTVTVPVTDSGGHVATATIGVLVGSPPGDVLPTPQSTGWQHTGVTLKAYTGATTIPAGTVLDSVDITKPITNAGQLTIRRSRITAGGLMAVNCTGPGDVLLEDVEITGSYDRSIQTSNRKAGTLTCRRVYAHGGLRGLDFTGDGNPIRLEDSYFAFNSNPGSGERSHASAIRAAGGIRSLDVVNTVLGVGTSSWSSGLIATYPENGPNSGVRIVGGLWIVQADNSGAYGIAAGYTPSAGEKPNSNFVVKDLWVSTEFYPSGCPSGVGQHWNQLAGTNVWSNVRKYHPGFAEHGQQINPG